MEVQPYVAVDRAVVDVVADTVGDKDFEAVAAGIHDEQMMKEDLLYGEGQKFTCKSTVRRVKTMRGSIGRTEGDKNIMYPASYF